jgi:methionine biosynthesis protein MetW
MSDLRSDVGVISGWISPNSTVLDLGCGDGSLIHSLGKSHNTVSYGIELDLDNIEKCIKKGVNVIRLDIDKGLSCFEDQSFDYVVIANTIQLLYHPAKLLHDMLRVGRNVIVTFPNYGHISNRYQLVVKGRAPQSKIFPYSWHDTPNIHLCSVKDFIELCEKLEVQVINRHIVNRKYKTNRTTKLFPNLFGEIAFFHLKT